MSLQFILGRIHTDKKTKLYEQMIKRIQEDKDDQVFYIVPDHMKFESEMSLLNHIKSQSDDSHLAGMVQLQVFSFTRLAWYFLQDTALFSRSQLTETGLTMLMRRILRENEEKLTLFRGESQQQGFVEKVTELFMELRTGRVLPNDLEEASAGAFNLKETGRDLSLKLNDIRLLYNEFLTNLEGKYIEKEDVIDALIKEVGERDLSRTTIVIDHFHHFSAQEQELILQMALFAKEVKISLVLNQKQTDSPPELTDFFYQTALTYHRLYKEALNRRIPVLHDDVCTGISNERCAALNDFEAYWSDSFELTPKSTKHYPKNLSECVEIREAETKQAEVLHVATSIKKLVAMENYRYKDILVVSRHLEDYKLLMESTLAENNIPLFIDQADKMANHALVEMIQSLLLMNKRFFRYEYVMRFLRTELFVPITPDSQIPKRQEEKMHFFHQSTLSWRYSIDTLENVMLAYGYEGSDWIKEEEWIYARFHLDEMDEQLDADKLIQKQANEAKTAVQAALLPFFKRLNEAKTNHDAARLLYQFLEKHHVNDQLLNWRDWALEKGDLEEARKHEQVWQTFMQLLDEFVDVLGDEEWDSDSFLSILETGFEQATYSIVPPSIDQVHFTTFDKTRPSCKKVVFILGLTDTQLPMPAENDSILTDEDRDLLQNLLPEDKYLQPATSGRLATEPFTAYLAFMNASQKLILSYPVANDGAGDNRMSPYVSRLLKDLNITLQKKKADAISLSTKDNQEFVEFIGSRRQTAGQLVTILRDRLDNKVQPSVFWLKLFYHLKGTATQIEEIILSSLEYSNIPKRIPEALAEELYGKDLYLSVSQLESFYLDPYSHFLQYGLKLRERAIQELTPAETGTFFHDALDTVFRTIVSKNTSVDKLSSDELKEVTDEVLETLYGQSKFKLLSMSNRMRFIRKQLSDTIEQMVKALSLQAKRTNMQAKKSEVLFGRLGTKQGVPGLSLPLNTGGTLHVRGKIDRLDAVKTDQGLYLSVVDYKSSSKKLEFDDIYHGLMMQMLTYLDTAVEHSEELLGEKAKPAGAFYAHINNPVLKAKDLTKKEWLDVWLSAFKLNGLVLKEDELIEQMDLLLPDQSPSLVYPLKYVKTRKQIEGKLITLEDLDLLLKHNREKIREAGNRIVSGENTLSPIYDKKRFTPSVGGSYHAISQFDVLLPNNQNNYRNLGNIKSQDDLIEKLKDKYPDLSDKGGED